MRRVVILLLCLLALPACRRWHRQVVPGLAMAAPEQEDVASVPPLAFQREGYDIKLTPRARYAVRAWVLATDDSRRMDDWTFVMPLDVGLAWGALADPAVLEPLSFHLARRYISVSWDRTPSISDRGVMVSMSNHHLLPSDPQVHATLKRLRPGHLVELRGYLVDVDVTGGDGRRTRQFHTSLSREDIGSGACEILYVETAAIVR